ncbi:MAG: hypothetical protein PW791_15645 [Neorhizobium sp.]|jgi:hypothetical protein|nr:hypothetical protein [Neorhizobium sp.]
MQNTRRARAIAIAKAEDGSKLNRWILLMITVGATAAIVAAPKLF